MKTKKQAREKEKKPIGLDKILSISIAVALIAFILTLIPHFLPTGEKILIPEQISSEVFKALVNGGITSSNTITEGNTIKISYQLPADLPKENAELYILGVLSVVAPDKAKAIISTYSGENKLGTIEVQMGDILTYKNKEIALDQFKSRFRQI